MTNLDEFQKKTGLNFKNKDILIQIFTHRSYLNENPNFKLDHNERLEFLGDAVLELVVTDYLFKNYPNPEGELTNLRSALVKGKMLSDIAGTLNLNEYILLSKGEAKSEGKSRQIILANAVEALIGGIYLDQGYDTAKDFINKNVLNHLPDIIDQKLYLDPKSHLQELSQAKIGVTPSYKVLAEEGPDHNKTFIIGCFLGEEKVGQGSGSSKQEAESTAAIAGLKHFEKEI